MSLTKEQLAALKRVAAYMDEMYSVARPYHGCTEDANLLRAMIDSSEHVTDHTKMIDFDLEAARAGIAHYRIENPSNVDTESHLKDLVDQANLAEEYLAEIERLRADLEQAEICIQARLDVIDQQAARIQELGGMLSIRTEELEIAHSCARSEREMHEKELVVFARKIPELEEALAEERAKYNMSWKDCAYRAPDTYCEKTHNYCTSEDCPLLDEQKTEARRQLRAEGKIDSSEHIREPPKMVGFDLVARIRELEAENVQLLAALDESERVVAHKTKSAAHWYDEHLQARADRVQTRRVVEQRAARIKELEDALVEERGNKMIQTDDCTQNQEAADIHHRCICEYNVKKCPVGQWWLDRARVALQAEGKIGPDDSKKISHLRPYEVVAADLAGMLAQSWQITDERKAALGVILARIEYDQSLPGRFNYTVSRAKDTLRAMLEEAQP